jgi:hypothetical protein
MTVVKLDNLQDICDISHSAQLDAPVGYQRRLGQSAFSD